MKADLHIHTNFSHDASSPPEEIVEAAIAKGIKCICITDHGETKGAIEAMKFAYDKDILVVPGIEILSNSGDILGINIKKIIPNGLSPEKTIEAIRRQGGLAVVPHPFARSMLGFWGGERKLETLTPDAIEVFNACIFFSSGNRRAFSFSQRRNLSFTAGSDAHRKDFVGRGYIDIPENISSEKDLMEAIMAKKAEARGRRLSPVEMVKNGFRVDIRDVISYYRTKRRAVKKLKKELL